MGHNYSAVAKHTLDVGHRIDWNNAKILYYNNNVGKRRVLEGALINLNETFENNKSFTQEDKITNFMICKNLNIEIHSHFGTPTARAPSLSPSQVLAIDDSISTGSNTGTDAVTPTNAAISTATTSTTATTSSGQTTITSTATAVTTISNQMANQPLLRRSTRIALRSSQRPGIA